MRKITYKEAITEALMEEMRSDSKVFIMGEDIGLYGGCFGITAGFLEEFGPERIRETPISESSFTGLAVGAAMAGMKPVVELMFSDFVTLSSDQLINHAAKMRFMTGGQVKVPMVLRTPVGSGTGAAAQHSQSLEAMFTQIPGLKVIMPSTPYDAKGLLKAAIRDENPIVFFEHKVLYKVTGEVPEEEYVLPIGKADIKREGEDVTIVTYSIMVHKVLNAAKELEKDGINVEVVDLRTLTPLDEETITNSVKKTGKLMVIHEACKTGGFGAEIVSAIAESEAFYYLDAPMKRVCGLNMPIPYTPDMERQVVPQEADIINAVKKLMK